MSADLNNAAGGEPRELNLDQAGKGPNGHCRPQPHPYSLDTSHFDPPDRLHPKTKQPLYFSWADRTLVEGLARDAWNLVAPFMAQHAERIVPAGNSLLIRIVRVNCGFMVERFERRQGPDVWPIDVHTGGFTLQGPCSAQPLEPISMRGVKPGSLRSVEVKAQMVEELREGIQLVRSMQHVVHITHGHHQLDLILGGQYPDTGGQNEYVNKFAQNLARLGARSTIFNRGGYLAGRNDPHSGWEFSNDLTVGVIRMEDSISARWERKEDMAPFTDALAYDMAQWLQAERVDVVIAHYWDAAVEAAHLRQLLKADFRIIFIPHSLGEHKRRNELKKRDAGTADWNQQAFDALNFDQRIDCERRMLDTEIDMVASTSQELTDLLQGFYGYPEERIRTLAPGYDDDLFKPVRRQGRWIAGDPDWQHFGEEIIRIGQFPPDKDLHWLQNEALFITEVSRTDQTKRKHLILDAIDAVSQVNPNVVLLINIADGERSELGRQLRSRLDGLRARNPNLLVAPFANASDDFVQKMHCVAKMYVTMSTQEGFGMSVLNAAASGKPCIFTNCVPFGVEHLLGPNQRQVRAGVVEGDAGLMVEVENSQALAAGILHLLSSRERRQAMGRIAHERALPFSWSRCTEEFLRSIGCLNGGGKVDFAPMQQFPRRFEEIH